MTKKIFAEGHRSFCADTAEDVKYCIECGASLITANDPRPLLKALKG